MQMKLNACALATLGVQAAWCAVSSGWQMKTWRRLCGWLLLWYFSSLSLLQMLRLNWERFYVLIIRIRMRPRHPSQWTSPRHSSNKIHCKFRSLSCSMRWHSCQFQIFNDLRYSKLCLDDVAAVSMTENRFPTLNSLPKKWNLFECDWILWFELTKCVIRGTDECWIFY